MSITLQPGEHRELNVQLTPLPVEEAALHGIVSDAETGLPVAGALVQITGTGGGYQATSGTDGYYQILGIEPGTYDGMVTHADYEPYHF